MEEERERGCRWPELIQLSLAAMVRARLPANSAVVEDEKLTLHCQVVGTDPEIQWTIHGEWWLGRIGIATYFN